MQGVKLDNTHIEEQPKSWNISFQGETGGKLSNLGPASVTTSCVDELQSEQSTTSQRSKNQRLSMLLNAADNRYRIYRIL